MSVELHSTWTGVLVKSAETGMGFQVLEIETAPRKHQRIVVLNGSVALAAEEQRLLVRERFEKAAERRALEILTKAYQAREFRVLHEPELSRRRLVERSYRAGSGPALDATPEQCKTAERFLRFSAFVNDVRISTDGSVRPGTFAATYDDGTRYVKTGMDAVRRYALPVATPASHRFHLEPPAPVIVRRGTVQPANNQPGGGAEVIFDGGAPAHTCYTKDQIPDGT